MAEIEENQNHEKDFIIEKIKERPVNKGRLLRRTVVTAAMAVIFGLVACFTFLLLEPVISNLLYPPQEEPTPVIFPEDQEEMSPEEMLSDTMLAEKQHELEQEQEKQDQEAEESEPEKMQLEQEEIDKILDSVRMNRDHYEELYSVMSLYVNGLKPSMVTVTGISSEVDWLDNEEESKNQSYGVIVANNEQELYILTDYSKIKNAERLTVTFYNSSLMEAVLRQYDPVTELAIVVVNYLEMPEELKENVKVAALGSSFIRNMTGIPVVAMGSPMGINGSVCYGMITANATALSLVDASYKLIYTDIYGSSRAGGVLFNMKNEVIGIITDDHHSSDTENIICAYGISELKKLITRLSNSNGTQMPYLGITAVDVSTEAQSQGIPSGAYITNIEKNSPLLLAGIQRGDIIVSIGDQEVGNMIHYSSALLNLEAGQSVEIGVLRLSQEEYKEMSFTVTVEGVGIGE